MALTIVNEQYPPRKPKLTLTADSLDELPTEGVAEGSTANVGGTEYVYENNSGWIEPGSGGGGGGSTVSVEITNDGTTITAEKTWDEISAPIQAGSLVWLLDWRQARTAFYSGLWDNKHAFVSVYYDQYSQVHFGKYTVDSDNTWAYEELTLPSS